jgi:hypothetical protein
MIYAALPGDGPSPDHKSSSFGNGKVKDDGKNKYKGRRLRVQQLQAMLHNIEP